MQISVAHDKTIRSTQNENSIDFHFCHLILIWKLLDFLQTSEIRDGKINFILLIFPIAIILLWMPQSIHAGCLNLAPWRMPLCMH